MKLSKKQKHYNIPENELDDFEFIDLDADDAAFSEEIAADGIRKAAGKTHKPEPTAEDDFELLDLDADMEASEDLSDSYAGGPDKEIIYEPEFENGLKIESGFAGNPREAERENAGEDLEIEYFDDDEMEFENLEDFDEDAETVGAAKADAKKASGKKAAKKKRGAKKASSDASVGERINLFFESIFANFTKMDGLVCAMGVFILIAAIVVAAIWVNRVNGDGQSPTMAQTGQQLTEIGILGQSGLMAVTNAQLAKQQAQITPEAEADEPEEGETIEVRVSFTSVEKDLKIKFINNETEKLVNNAAFRVILTDSAGKEYEYTDDDMDGIVYKTSMSPGKYTVQVEAPERYEIVSCDTTVTVRDTIVYEQIDVAAEIKSESEVNTATEDTQMNVGIEEEIVTGELQDTVEWVESTKTTIGNASGYAEIPKSSIADPSLVASRAFYALAATLTSALPANAAELTTQEVTVSPTTGEITPTQETPTPTTETNVTPTPTTGTDVTPTPDVSETPTPSPSLSPSPSPAQAVVSTVTLDRTTAVLYESGTPIVLKATVTMSDQTVFTSETAGYVTWTSSDEKIVKVDGNGNLTPVARGTATVTAASVMADGQGNQVKAVCTVTVNATTLSITIDRQNGSVHVGSQALLVATVIKNGTAATSAAAGLVTWTSSDQSVATVDEKGVVTGVKPGTAVITATTVDKDSTGKQLTVTCTITVLKDVTKDTTTKLKDQSGNQVYVVNSSGQYVEAVNADYFSASKFYIKSDVQYRYTGWQTIDNKTYYFDKNGNYVTGEQVILGVKYNFDSDGVLSMGNGTLGIDVSKWNGTINWTAVKNAGVSYVIIRCGYRGSTLGALIEDSMFRQNIEGANAAGIKVGVYFFTQAINEVEAVEEASMVLSLVKKYKISYPIFIDTEACGGRADNISRDTRTAVVRAFCETIRNAGYTPGVYASKSWYVNNLNASSLSSYKIWLAQYATTPTYTGHYDLWQYTDKGTISGISGYVDLNYSYLGY